MTVRSRSAGDGAAKVPPAVGAALPGPARVLSIVAAVSGVYDVAVGLALLAAPAAGPGFAWALIRRGRQSLHERLAGTALVDAG